ncbi:anthranilate phosphoribosyltransferase [Bacillus tianshenii]|nr:anthranilate phosphoribosyltransferase [Bacillus tianshenii]
MLKQTLRRCAEGKTLTEKEAEQVMNSVMQGSVDDVQLSSLLSIMLTRGETAEEITGFTRAMRSHMRKLHYHSPVFDTCGTGGDGASTYNISTATAVVLASLGVKVAKHGNRSVSSKSGSADVLESIGVQIQQSEEEALHSLDQHNMTFLYAPHYHAAMKHVGALRKNLGFRTVFNLLGPLSNPAQSTRQIIGVYDIRYGVMMAEALRELGSEHVLIVSSRDGLDEISVAAETDVIELKNGQIHQFVLSPEDLGLNRCSLDGVKADSVEESARLFEKVLYGEGSEAAQNILYLNAGAAFYAAGGTSTIAEGVHRARQAILDGTTEQKLTDLRGVGAHA